MRVKGNEVTETIIKFYKKRRPVPEAAGGRQPHLYTVTN